MRLLLDTHTYFWWVRDRPELSACASARIGDQESDVFVSAVVSWELATKGRLGKWPGADEALRDLGDAMETAGFEALPISLAHARRAGELASPHKDPFDRMLAAQATHDGLTLPTRDPAFRTLGCRTLW